ncbi:MAG: hypothetical protein QME05_01310 [Candidatus Margulisbacteria bacterium]|nr:hypothetical protein [Candidatus Margulisiibacteriota bacterium]
MKNENFYPLTLTRKVEDLRCGTRTVGEHGKQISYLWDLLVGLKEDLERDLKGQGSRPACRQAGVKGQVHPSVVLLAPENILIEEGAEIEPLAVLDARSGPIYIGKKSVIKAHANLRGPVSIGPECKIGGEVSHSIFHGYSNKAHYGFIGHSYIGEWVNLGAGTTNSNLKNTYGTVKVWVNGKEVDSGQQFLGCFIGDHVKTGIGTLITTGAVIGVGAHWFGGGVTPKVIPNFAWGKEGKIKLEKMLAIAHSVMGRRQKKLSQEEENKLRNLY